MVYLSQAVGELRRGDRVHGRSLGLDDDRDLEVVTVQVDPDDPSGEMILLEVETGWTAPLRSRESRSRIVRLLVPEAETAVSPEIRERCAAAYADADDDPEKTAALFGIELLSLQWRLSQGNPSPVVVPIGWAPGDPHPLDVTIEDVETVAADAIANVIVWMENHGYDSTAIVSRAWDYAKRRLAAGERVAT